MVSSFKKFAVVLVSSVLFVTSTPVVKRPDILRRQGGIPAVGSGPATAADGSIIVEDEVVINGLNMRFKVSAPSAELVSNSGAAAGTLGVNVLFHGDGGQSFFDFPNQGVNAGLMGVALLSPDPGLRWGGSSPASSLARPDGPAHSAAVNQFLTNILPQVVNFDSSKIFMEGVSGGSLLLSGFLIPTFGSSLAVPGVVFGCGGLAPQVAVQGDLSNLRIHWQSTTNELADLIQSIPPAILAYEQNAAQSGLNAAQINQLQTADASPNGGHCEFDEQDFVSGVQLLTDNFGAILSGNSNAQGVVGNENLFGGATSNNQQTGTGATTTTQSKSRNGRGRKNRG